MFDKLNQFCGISGQAKTVVIERVLGMYIDNYYAKQAQLRNKLGEFLRFNGRKVLEDFGTVKREVAEKLALEQYKQYEQYDARRRTLETVDDVDELTANVKRLKQ